MKFARDGVLLFVLVALAACSSSPPADANYTGTVTAVLLRLPPDQADMVGCGVGLTSSDGKPDLHFHLSLVPASVGDVSMVELERGGEHPGRWQSMGVNFYPLGVAKPGANTAIDTTQRLRALDYDQAGLDLFACDDGATTAADTFFATITLGTGQVHKTATIPGTH
jgi:hypothetical protein